MLPHLERISWIAGIASAVLAVATLGWSVWTYYRPLDVVQKSQVLPSSSQSGIALEWKNNLSLQQERFIEIKDLPQSITFPTKKQHELHYPHLIGKLPPDVLPEQITS